MTNNIKVGSKLYISCYLLKSCLSMIFFSRYSLTEVNFQFLLKYIRLYWECFLLFSIRHSLYATGMRVPWKFMVFTIVLPTGICVPWEERLNLCPPEGILNSLLFLVCFLSLCATESTFSLLSLETRDICWRTLLLCIQAGSAWVFFTIFLHQIPCLTTIRPYYTWAKAMARLIDPWRFLLWNFHSYYFFFVFFSICLSKPSRFSTTFFFFLPFWSYFCTYCMKLWSALY